MKKIGLLGCGAIGTQIALAIDSGKIPATLTHVYDQSKEAAESLVSKFQGMELWVVTAVSVKSDGRIIKDLHDHGLGYPEIDLSSMASKMEIDACNSSVGEVDLVLMDGSLYSQFMTRQSTLSSTLLKIMTKKENVIFISKTSNTRMQFADMDSTAGDIFLKENQFESILIV